MDALLNRIELHLITLSKEQIIAAALRANFKKVDVLSVSGQYCESIALSLLLRKYFFGACTVLFTTLPIDVFKYIGDFFDFDIKFHKRTRDCVGRFRDSLHRFVGAEENAFVAHIMRATEEPTFADAMLNEAVATHIKSDITYCVQYYRMQQRLNIEKNELVEAQADHIKYLRQELKVNTKRLGKPAATLIFDNAFALVRAHQHEPYERLERGIRNYMESMRESEHFAPKLLILEASERYSELVRRIAANGFARTNSLPWRFF